MTNNKATILVVEDDLNLMHGIRDILELDGYNVLTATNGLAGLEVLREQPVPPDLIVSDIMMPHMNGYDFFNTVRGIDSWVAIPFIFLTAKGDRDDIRRGKLMGAEDYVVKPFDAEDLLIAVYAKLDRKKQLDNAWQSEMTDIKHNILTILNHEMRTPLTYVVAYADMLMNRNANDVSADDMRGFLRGINAGANRLRRLVENFILLVDLETGQAEETFGWRSTYTTKYEDIFNRIVKKYMDIALENRITLCVQVDDDLPGVVADINYLTASLECLVDNAIKFSTKPDTTVTLHAYAEGEYVCLAVEDHGRGIPQHELKNIFENFYQINREKYEDQGAGSGLAIVNNIVRIHGGSISVESIFGQGSTFVIHLPIADNTGADQAG
ncbi:MAG: HAMP domain-containing histidine kinase [Anaerolineae bacterium]|nr:HAMP domain-containing histidine kinase [Anaerolineae bacterium]